jgi:hypothetical protein
MNSFLSTVMENSQELKEGEEIPEDEKGEFKEIDVPVKIIKKKAPKPKVDTPHVDGRMPENREEFFIFIVTAMIRFMKKNKIHSEAITDDHFQAIMLQMLTIVMLKKKNLDKDPQAQRLTTQEIQKVARSNLAKFLNTVS